MAWANPFGGCARCSICSANFPLVCAGQLCPICEIDTLEGIQNDVPDDKDELKKRVNEANFERYLEETGRA